MSDDRRWQWQNINTPVLVIDMVRTAELWAILHPGASRDERQFIAALVSDALGAA